MYTFREKNFKTLRMDAETLLWRSLRQALTSLQIINGSTSFVFSFNKCSTILQLVEPLHEISSLPLALSFGKTGNKNVHHALQHCWKTKLKELKSDVAPFSTHVQTCWQPDLLEDRLDVGNKTHNIAVFYSCSSNVARQVACFFVAPFFRTLRWFNTGRFATTILAQHSVAMLEQCCNHLTHCRNNVATLCCARKSSLRIV